MMLSRRAFLQASVHNSALVALAPSVPAFLARAARAATPERDRRVLVVIQLEGGNDGVNTVVPFKDEGYARYRKVLRLPTDRLLKINQEIGLHPAMTGAAKLLETGRVAIVQGVGYPNPSRSHFQSAAIWQTARVKPSGGRKENGNEGDRGWLGWALDSDPRPADHAPDSVFVGTDDLPLALWGRRSVASSLANPEDYLLTLKGGHAPQGDRKPDGSDLADFVTRSTLDAYANSAQIAAMLRGKDRGRGYPGTALASRLEVIARLLKSDVNTRVFYTSHAWYDTHAAQLPEQEKLLGEFSGALHAFLDDLATAKLADRVTVLCFSEFGRRVAENASQGTDHGTAGPVFVAGPAVHAGLIGSTPRLLELDDGDLRWRIDFRQVYASLLEDWLGISSIDAVGGRFERLPLFRT
jgi:uncharacterized protein (DUF1501 family)